MKIPFIQIRYLDGLRYQRAVVAGCKEIISHEDELNKINYFPIPDKDTGSNLKKTLSTIIENYPILEPAIGKASQQMALQMLTSALGFSGIIFAQFFSGFADKVGDKKRIFVNDLAETGAAAANQAYDFLKNPVEGTILSVLNAWSYEVKRLSLMTEDFVFLFRESLKKAAEALKKTPEQLEILKKHKVVDAGGHAFFLFLKGIANYLEKGKLQPIVGAQRRKKSEEKTVVISKKAEYCFECCLREKNLDHQALINRLNSLGQDLIFYGSINFAKIHLRTDKPNEVSSAAAQFGKISSQRILKFSPDLAGNEKQELALVSDTTCDIADDYIENNDIYFVPIKVQVLNRMYTDKVDLIPEEFYRIMAKFPVYPKTSQPSLMDFLKVYEHLLAHYKSIISVHLSSNLSGTFQTALRAADKIAPERVAVIDSKSTSIGLGLIMIEGLKTMKEGLDFEAVFKRIKEAVQNIEIFVGIPTLKYLIKGGRVTRTKQDKR